MSFIYKFLPNNITLASLAVKFTMFRSFYISLIRSCVSFLYCNTDVTEHVTLHVLPYLMQIWICMMLEMLMTSKFLLTENFLQWSIYNNINITHIFILVKSHNSFKTYLRVSNQYRCWFKEMHQIQSVPHDNLLLFFFLFTR